MHNSNDFSNLFSLSPGPAASRTLTTAPAPITTSTSPYLVFSDAGATYRKGLRGLEVYGLPEKVWEFEDEVMALDVLGGSAFVLLDNGEIYR